MSTSQRVLRNATLLATQTISSVVISVLVNGYIAKKLGPSDYGKFVFGFSFATIFSIFSDLGLYGWGVREIARHREKTAEILGDIVAIRTVLSLLVFGVICFAVNALRLPESTRLVVYIGSASVVLLGCQFANTWIVFEAHESAKFEGTSNLICRFLVGALSIMAVYHGFGFIQVSLIYMLGYGTEVIYCFIILKRHFVLPRFHISFKKYVYEIKAALPFAFLSLFTIVYYEIDKNMLAFIKGDTSVGLYNAATTIVYKCAIISGALAIAILPPMINDFKVSAEKLGDNVSHMIPLLLMLGIPISIVGTVFAPDIIHLIYRSSDYSASVLTLQILIWMVPFEFLSHILRFSLIAADKQIAATFISGITVFINICLNVVFITRFDFNGAALATVVAEATSVMLLLAYFTINIVRIQVNIKMVAVITAGILTGICTYFLHRVVNLWSFPVGASFYLIQILLFRILSKDDLKVLISAFRSES